MISELRRGFEIGLWTGWAVPGHPYHRRVSTMSMDMMMLLPLIGPSLPAKLLFFVMIDGWNLLIGSLVRSVA